MITKEDIIQKLQAQAEIVAENNDDTLLWYMQEYRDKISPTDIAVIFTKTFKDRVFKLAFDLEDDWEKEELA